MTITSFPTELPVVEILLQPIVDLSTGVLVAAEALARFPDCPQLSVDEVFRRARAAGMGLELEAACLRAALARRSVLPRGVVLNINVSPAGLDHPDVVAALAGDLSGVNVELTEHPADRVGAIRTAVAALRDRGALISVDDASTGYSGLLRLCDLRPDGVKLDRGLITGGRNDIARSVVIDALVLLSRRIGAYVVGEGAETVDDLAILVEHDVDYAQGWLIGEPAAQLPAVLPLAVEACRAARAAVLATSSPPSSPSFNSVTAALAGTVRVTDLQHVLHEAAGTLGVDIVSLSTLSAGGFLHEITTAGQGTTAAGKERAPRTFALADFPATRESLTTDRMLEAHLNDPASDEAERRFLADEGWASLLLAPVLVSGMPLAVLEFGTLRHHRWTGEDLARARSLAEHVGNVLIRLEHASA